MVDSEGDSELEASPAGAVVLVEASTACNNNGVRDDTVSSTTVPVQRQNPFFFKLH